jgi:uncharacterized membrane protein
LELLDWFGDSFLGKSLLTFFVAMLPVVELRGAIPIGVALGLEVKYSFLVAVMGNLLHAPFIIVFIRRVLEWLQHKSKWLDRLLKKKVEKTMKNQSLINKYEMLD